MFDLGTATLTPVLLLVHERPGYLSAVVRGILTPPTTPGRMVAIPGGSLRPIYAGSGSPSRVEAFYLDRDPVTNAEYLRFVKFFFNFRRDRISPLFADEDYLARWKGPTELGPRAEPGQPVTNVSWFTAKAYCAARGARLPTEVEWEYAASASETQADATSQPGWTETILGWYAHPSPDVLPPVGQSKANYFGVRDLHGLVWEWVLDFNSTLVTSDSRGTKGADTQTFCGAGALGLTDSRDYAGFMRSAFRSSLAANYTARSLGFRCARDSKAAAGQ
jgi:sulfatase modifying factor 1